MKVKLETTEIFLLKECEKQIRKRGEKISQIDDAFAIYKQYELLNSPSDAPGASASNAILAKKAGISRRAFIYKKNIGANISRKLRRVILQNPVLNHFKLLYSISKLPHPDQEIVIGKVLAYLKAGAKMSDAMIAAGLKKKKNTETSAPTGKVQILIDRDVAALAKRTFPPDWPLSQRVENLICMEAHRREQEKREQQQQQKQYQNVWRF